MAMHDWVDKLDEFLKASDCDCVHRLAYNANPGRPREALVFQRPWGQRHDPIWMLTLSRTQIGDNGRRIVP
jgi:hypothetical protein